jgi:hypothetical protein
VKGNTPRSLPGRMERNVRGRKKADRQTDRQKIMFLLVASCLTGDRQSYDYTTSIFPFRKYIIYTLFCPANQISATVWFYKGARGSVVG